MAHIELKINGFPVAQGRPRAFRCGNGIRMYDPAKSKGWKDEIRLQAKLQSVTMLDGALHMELSFFMPRPKSLPKKVLNHVKKPDLDNLCKAVKDALKGLAYKDDSQIVSLIASKVYEADTGVDIRIFEKEL